MPELREAVLVDFVRTPFGRANQKKPGFFAGVRSDDLGIIAVKALLKRTGVDPALVEDIIVGTPTQLGEQANIGRDIGLAAGFPFDVPGLGVDRACCSSMAGAHIGIMAVQTGDADIIIAGGIESLSHFPNPVITPDSNLEEMAKDYVARWQANPKIFDRIDPTAIMGMGISAENLSDMFDITREEMDRWALRSNLRAAAARKEGRLKHAIVPVEGKLPDGTVAFVDYDQDVRDDSTLEKVQSLPPVYKPDGRITAASSSKSSDGAAMAMFMSKEKAAELGLKPMVTVKAIAWAACDPTLAAYSAYSAAEKVLKRAGMSPRDIDLWEINEAFAAVSLALIKGMGIDPERVNVNGGACCIGHPVGASGIWLLGTLAHEMNRRGSRYGLACIPGGIAQGAATIVEREEYGAGRPAFLQENEPAKP